jgi:hypothetical protein
MGAVLTRRPGRSGARHLGPATAGGGQTEGAGGTTKMPATIEKFDRHGAAVGAKPALDREIAPRRWRQGASTSIENRPLP